ncbi:MAG: aminotransferase class V-fold PLP-dependent enzyme [Phycisphaerales bacterium]
MELVYLDNNATTKPADEVIEAVRQAQAELWANPSSVHRPGQLARQKVELARASVAELLGTHPRQLVFTSGGTESNNLAIRGVLGDASNGVLVTSKLEHSAVREPAEAFGKIGKTVWLPIDPGGAIDPRHVAEAIDEHADGTGAVLISVQWANNETGVIQPIREIAEAVAGARERVAAKSSGRPKVFARRCVPGCGQAAGESGNLAIDLMSMSGHKLHGPKGVGVLYVRQGLRLQRQMHGGPQELQRRGGTENTAAIIGLGVAAELAAAFLKDTEHQTRLTVLRDRFEASVLQSVPGSLVNGPTYPGAGAAMGLRLWNTSNIAFPGLEAEAILLGLSERGVCASAGAACSSGSLEPSPVLLAMGVPEPVAHGSVRFSLSRDTTDAEVDQALRVLPEVVRRLGRVMPVG